MIFRNLKNNFNKFHNRSISTYRKSILYFTSFVASAIKHYKIFISKNILLLISAKISSPYIQLITAPNF